MKAARTDLRAPLQRRDLITVLTYVNRSARSQKYVGGSFGTEAHLDRLAAAAGMQ